MIKRAFLVVLFVVVAVISGFFIEDRFGFSYGIGVAVINLMTFWCLYSYHRRRVSNYFGAGLVAVVKMTVYRSLIVILLLLVGLMKLQLSSSAMILGFVLGQLFFLVHQIQTVSENNGE